MIDKFQNHGFAGGILFVFVAIFYFFQSYANGQGLPESVLSKLRAEDNPEWKVVWDKKKGVAKRLFNARSKAFPGKSQDAARGFLSSYHDLFGLSPDLNNLQVQESKKTPLGERVLFRQYHNHIPVMGADVRVHVSDKNNVFLVENYSIPNIKIDTQPQVEKDEAIGIAEKALSFGASMVEKVSAELVVLPSGPEQNLAWRVIVSKKGLVDKTWLVYVDAKKKGWVLFKKKLQSSATGAGRVYIENPITTPSLSNVSLPNLTDGTFFLEGDFGKSYNAECINSVSDTSDLSGFSSAFSFSRNYSYTGDDNRLEEVMAYYHQTNMHDTLKALFGFSSLDDQIPIFVNAQDPNDPSVGYDNAFYSRDDNFPSTGYMLFGCGNVLNNLGLDSNVITHEYGHAVLDHINPQLLEVIEHNYSGATHESVGDVMASHFGDNEIIGEWGLTSSDGTQDFTRNMDNTRTYPEDVYEPSLGVSEVHYTGEILNGVYWDIKNSLSSDTAFRLFFSAINLLPNDANFFDVRDAWVEADSALFDGANTEVIETAFANHGIEGEDPGNEKATLKLTKMIFYKLDPNTGTITKQKNFSRGDAILVYLKADISKLTPAYNFLPVEMTLIGNGADTFQGSLTFEEALNGKQQYMIAFLTSDFASGRIKVKARVRLGGTDDVKVKKGSFTIK